MRQQFLPKNTAFMICLCGLLSFATNDLAAQAPKRPQPPRPDSPARPAGKLQRTQVARPVSPPVGELTDQLAAEHPLTPVLKYAREEQIFLRKSVRDFTSRLVKRERMRDELQQYQYIDMTVREEKRELDKVTVPLAVLLHFVGPASVTGRKVLYVAGENDGKMIVRKGGKRFGYVVVQTDPLGETARLESEVPITQTGFGHILDQMIATMEADMRTDPSGDNTQVTRVGGAKVNHRLCDLIRVVHPQQQKGLKFHKAEVFVDTELHVPVRIDAYGWPTVPGETPPVLAEFTYTELKLNVGLDEALFTPEALRD